MPKPSLAALRYAARRRLRRTRYALEDVSYAARRHARRASSGTARRWSGLTLRARQRLAGAGVALAVVLLATLLVAPNLPCRFPGGAECQPSDDAVELVPGDALAYAHVTTDRGTEQFERAAAVASRLPSVADQVIARIPGPSGAELDYRRQVAPWLGGEAALALLPANRGDPERVVLLEVGDEGGAREFVDRLAGPDPELEEHREVELRLVTGGPAVASVGGFVVVGPEDQVRRVIDTEIDGGSLRDSAVVRETRDGFPDLRLAELFVTEDGAQELLAPGAPLGTFEAFVNVDATRGAGVAAVAAEDGLELDVRSLLDESRAESAPGFFAAFPAFEPALEEEVGENALAYLALGAPGRSIAALIAQAAAEAPGLAAGFEQVGRRLRRAGDLSLERDVLPVLASQAALSVEPRPVGEGGAEAPAGEAEIEQGVPGAGSLAVPEEGLAPAPETPGAAAAPGVPFISFVADDVDGERATTVLAALQGPIAGALDPGRTGGGPGFEERQIEGVEARSLRISPTVELTYAVIDDKLVISTDPLGVRQVRRDEASLEDSDRFTDATRGFDDAISTLLYLNVDGLLQLAEVAGLSADPAYATFGPEFRRLEALGVAVKRGEDRIDTQARLTVPE